MAYDRVQMVNDLIRDEGERLKPYTDTVGKLTVGIGRNLTDRGISTLESRYLCQNDLMIVDAELTKHVPWWTNMSESRQRGLVNMCFNLGWTRLSKFTTTLGHLEAGRYADAAESCLKSLWAKQVGARAVRIADLFRGHSL